MLNWEKEVEEIWKGFRSMKDGTGDNFSNFINLFPGLSRELIPFLKVAYNKLAALKQ